MSTSIDFVMYFMYLTKPRRHYELSGKIKPDAGSLEPFEQKVISMRFGLGEEHSHTLEEVGLAFDISRKKIRMIEAKVLRLLRKNVTRNYE